MSWAEIGRLFAETVLAGPMVAAIGVAVVAGIVSFASPCVLPLLPGYLGYLGGMSGQLGAQPASGPAETSGPVEASPRPVEAAHPVGQSLARSGPSPTDAGSRRAADAHAAVARAARSRGTGRLVAGVLLFVAGFTAVFVLLGVVFGWIGLALAPWLDVVTRVLGVGVVLMGLAFVGYLPFLQRDLRPHITPRAGVWGAPLLGVVFGLGWAPCIGPTLAAVLLLSLDGGTPWRGGILALAYCLGLGVPFVVIALAYHRAAGTVGFLRRHHRAITRIGGGMLVAVGLALVTGLWTRLADWIGLLVADFVTVV